MPRGEDFRGPCGIAFSLLIDRKLIDPNRFVFVNATFDVPSRKIPSIGARKSSCPESADRRALPKAIINMAAIQRRLLGASVRERLTDRPCPGGFRDIVIGAGLSGKLARLEYHDCCEYESPVHECSSTGVLGSRFDRKRRRL